MDAGDHEHEQQDHGEAGHDLTVDTVRVDEAEQHGFERQQAARLQRVARERHGEREDEFREKDP